MKCILRKVSTMMTIRRRSTPRSIQHLVASLFAFVVFVSAHAAETTPPRLTFDELVTLSKQQVLDPALQAKLNAVLTTPSVVNRPAPSTPVPEKLRVLEWNIERGEQLDNIEQLLKSPDSFIKRAQREKEYSARSLEKLRSQAATLRQSDVLILNEVDQGVKRTDYRNVTQELAQALGMSSAYSVEFLEVDSLTDLGTEPAVLNTPELSARMTEDLKPDRKRYQGMHGNAILSRYPLQNVRVLSLPECHDWFSQEVQAISQLEKAKRKAADVAFLERITREVRRGNRQALVADITLPGKQPVTVHLVNAHLENKCKADCRARQMRRVLEEIGDTTGPVILAGDLNTTGTDGTPTSIRYELTSRLKDYQFWIGTLLQFTPVGLPVYATTPFNFWKNYRDPTAFHLPVLARNQEAGMFANIRKFHFADDGSFDFRGLASRNLQKSTKTLSDSNERATKGFAPTFAMQRDYGGILRYRLDWIFVKPSEGHDDPGTFRPFEPEMPRTLEDLNRALPERLSDHAPITVELPLAAKAK
jgi:endonuclease/exonuclease/phosphatase family metal-dependent hydrolase